MKKETKQNIVKSTVALMLLAAATMIAASAATRHQDAKLLKDHLGQGIVIVDSDVGRYDATYIVAYGHCTTEVTIGLHRNVKVGACK